MKFKVFKSNKKLVKLSDSLILFGKNHKVPLEFVYLIKYQSSQHSYYHLLIQYQPFFFTNTIFLQADDLVHELIAHPQIKKLNLKVENEDDVTKDRGYLNIEGNRILSWGPVYDTGTYAISFQTDYRKEIIREGFFVTEHNYTLKDEHENLSLNLTRDINFKSNDAIPFNIWENNQAYWLKYYQQKIDKKNNSLGCLEIIFILILFFALIVLGASFF